MGSYVLSLSGLSARGRHGANPGERDEEQDFALDVEVRVEPAADSLSATTDYRTIAAVATGTVEKTSFELLESLADAVANAVQDLPGVIATTVTVHKPAAARALEAEDVAATATAGS